MSKTRLWTLAALVVACLPQAQAQSFKPGDVLLRGRAVYIDTANKDDIAVADVSVSKKTIPEVDISYFFSPNLAAELVLTVPQKHDVSAVIPSMSVNGPIGSLKHLPPTLSLQYHFDPIGTIKPYLGVGLNYTHFSSVNLPAGFTIDRNSTGLSLGGGADFMIDKQWSINLDLKKVRIRTDLFLNGANLGTIKVDPWLAGVGVGYKF